MKPQPNQLKILTEKEKKNILNQLKDQFGIKKIPGTLIKRGKERIFLYQGSFKEKEIKDLERITFVERVGVYFGKEETNQGVRLSIEGSQILKDQITKNIIELNEDEMQTWMMGHELLKKTGINGFVIIKYEEEMLGTGKASEEKITNFIPKSRRLKDKTIEV